MARDANFKSTIRAIKLSAPLKFDGRLDDEVYGQYRRLRAACCRPRRRYNEPSTEKTEIWVMFDGDNIYVAAKCWDTAPPEKWIANELRRDTNQMRQNDHFGVGFDTFYDRRSGYMFYANPIGGFSDYSVVDEGAPNTDWNPVWDVRRPAASTAAGRSRCSSRSSRCATPRAPIRCGASSSAARSAARTSGPTGRRCRSKMAGPQALNRVSLFGTVVGLDLPPAGTQPRAEAVRARQDVDRSADESADLERQRRRCRRRREVRHHREPHRRPHRQHRLRAGRDRRAAGQPDALQPVSSRRSASSFSRAAGCSTSAAAAPAAAAIRRPAAARDTPYLFYTPPHRPQSQPRRADRCRRPPDRQGRRVRRRRDEHPDRRRRRCRQPGTNFTVLRVKRDILRRSTIGAMFTNRNESDVEPAAATTRPTASMRRSASTRTSRSAATTRAPRRPISPATTRAIRASSTGRRIATA